MNKVIIFDFDGTLADSSSLIRKIYNEMAAEYGYRHMSEADYQYLRGVGPAKIQKWIGVKSWQIPKYMREGLKRFRKHSDEIKLFAGMPELIKKLAKTGAEMYILSANNPATIREVLSRHKVAAHVTVLKRSALFSKDYAIRHLMLKHKYQPEDVWMIGDEMRDVEAAKRAKVKAAAVTWGLQDKKLLQTAGPTVVATSPAELLAILQKAS